MGRDRTARLSPPLTQQAEARTGDSRGRDQQSRQAREAAVRREMGPQATLDGGSNPSGEPARLLPLWRTEHCRRISADSIAQGVSRQDRPRHSGGLHDCRSSSCCSSSRGRACGRL